MTMVYDYNFILHFLEKNQTVTVPDIFIQKFKKIKVNNNFNEI